jgi:hypothetical protein
MPTMTTRLLAAVLALLATPAFAAGTQQASARAPAPPAASGPDTSHPDLALLLGGEWGSGGYGAFRMRGDVGLDLRRPLAPNATLAGVLSVGLSHYGDEFTTGIPGFSVTERISTWTFDVVPTARANFAVQPRVTLYADAGLGIGFSSESLEVSGTGVPAASGSGSGAFGVIKLGAGGYYRLDDRFQLGAEIVGLNLRFGNGVGTTYSFLLAGSYRL